MMQSGPMQRRLQAMPGDAAKGADGAVDQVEFTRIDASLMRRAIAVMDLLKRKRLGLITAESCTGGLLAAVLSDAPGAGDWLHGGFVTYTAAHKTAALGVDPDLIETAGAVSQPVARAMAEGALARSPADLAVAITGVAGPEPDAHGTPVGTVHLAMALRGRDTLHAERKYGEIGRGPCRYCAVGDALDLIVRAADQ